MARFYSNENYPLPVVDALRTLGHDVLTSLEGGQANQRIPDADVLAFAVRERRAILTHNRRHFIRLHRQNSTHYGIVVCSFDSDFSRQAQAIHDATIEGGELSGKLIRINRPPRSDES